MTELEFPFETVDMGKALTVFLPKTLNLPDATTQSIVWVDEDEDHSSLPTPYGTFSLKQNKRMTSIDKNSGGKLIGVSQSDVIAYSDGTDTYQVTERDIKSITSLEATVGGTPNTPLTDGVDFVSNKTGDYSTYDSIRFLPAGTKPDDATNFTVVYDHTMLQQHVSSKWEGSVTLTLHVSDSHGTYRPKTIFADILSQGLTGAIAGLRGKRVAQGVRFRGIDTFMPATFDDGESIIRVPIQCRLSYHQKYVYDEVERVGDTDHDLDIDP